MAFTSLVKNMNERQVVECMRDGCMYTKQELARKTNLSFPTVGKLVDELTGRGMLLSLGTEESSAGGRKAGLYRMDGDFAHALLLFMQAETLFCAVSDALGRLIYRTEESCAKGAAVDALKSAIDKITEQDEKIRAVAVGVPGGVSRGKVCFIDGYEELKGRELEEELCAYTGLPVLVSNNMSALAYGLARYGGAQSRDQTENLVCIHLADTGPGCGMVVNGRPVSGFCGLNGEVGFMPLFGEKTLQQVALEGFGKISPGEYLGRLITCICTLLNPAKVILYIEQDWEDAEAQTLSWCGRFLPGEAVPQLVFADSYQEDYLQGLMALGTDILLCVPLYSEGIKEIRPRSEL